MKYNSHYCVSFIFTALSHLVISLRKKKHSYIWSWREGQRLIFKQLSICIFQTGLGLWRLGTEALTWKSWERWAEFDRGKKKIFSSNRPEACRKEYNKIQMNISSLEKVLLCKDLVIILTHLWMWNKHTLIYQNFTFSVVTIPHRI